MPTTTGTTAAKGKWKWVTMVHPEDTCEQKETRRVTSRTLHQHSVVSGTGNLEASPRIPEVVARDAWIYKLSPQPTVPTLEMNSTWTQSKIKTDPK
jgi:hypothetical protein